MGRVVDIEGTGGESSVLAGSAARPAALAPPVARVGGADAEPLAPGRPDREGVQRGRGGRQAAGPQTLTDPAVPGPDFWLRGRPPGARPAQTTLPDAGRSTGRLAVEGERMSVSSSVEMNALRDRGRSGTTE